MHERLMVKMTTGETIYLSASFAGSQPEFRDITNRAALERIQELLIAAGSIAPCYVEAPRIVTLA